MGTQHPLAAPRASEPVLPGRDDATPDVEGLAKCAADLVVAVTGVDLSGLAMFGPGGEARMLAASHNRSAGWAELTIEPGDGIAGQVLQRGGSVTIKNYARESGSSSHLIEVFSEAESAYGMLAVPIEQSGSIVGVVYGGVRRPEYIGDRGRLGLNNVAKLFSATFVPSGSLGSGADGLAADGLAAATDERVVTGRGDLAGGSGLSPRERRILELLGEGLSTRDVATTEFLAINTVRSYVQSALWKLGAHSRLQAVAIAREAGLI